MTSDTSDARLRTFLADTLALWGVDGVVEPGVSRAVGEHGDGDADGSILGSDPEGVVVAEIRAASGTLVWVERAIARRAVLTGFHAGVPKDARPRPLPLRWLARWRAAGAPPGGARERRARACASLAGLLNALRGALGVERGSAVRVAPAPDPGRSSFDFGALAPTLRTNGDTPVLPEGNAVKSEDEHPPVRPEHSAVKSKDEHPAVRPERNDVKSNDEHPAVRSERIAVQSNDDHPAVRPERNAVQSNDDHPPVRPERSAVKSKDEHRAVQPERNAGKSKDEHPPIRPEHSAVKSNDEHPAVRPERIAVQSNDDHRAVRPERNAVKSKDERRAVRPARIAVQPNDDHTAVRPERNAVKSKDERAAIPVSVITGFLGSGKTTLLAHLLRDPAMGRTAVIINEFGAIGLDHDLVETSDESFIRLSTGCLCCNVRSDLVLTLGDLAARRAAGTVPPFERVVIETTGLADPAPILHALLTDRDLGEIYALDSVITTVDALTGLETLAQHAESLRQAAVADRIVLTKTDVPGAQTRAVIERLAKVNPGASVLTAVHGAIAPSVLFEAGLYRVRGKHPDVEKWLAAEAIAAAHDHAPHRHDEDITSFCIVCSEPLHAATLALVLSALAENCGRDLLRLKGIVNIAEEPERPAVIHGVQHVYHAPVWLARWPSEDRRTRMVFIGRNIRESWIRALLDLVEAEVADETARHAFHRGHRPALSSASLDPAGT